MAQYFTDDFADWSTDWTERFDTAAADWTTVVSGGDVVFPNAASSSPIGMTWNDIDGDSSRGDIDILCVVRFSSFTSVQRWLMGRASGGSGTSNNFHISTSLTQHNFGYYSSGTRTGLASFAASYFTATDYWLRMRLSSSGPTTYKSKMWTGAASDEPGGVETDAGWDISSTTSSGPTAAGWNGFLSVQTSASTTVKQIGIGTGGDWGPSAAVAGAASLAFQRAFPRAILNF